MISSGSWRMGSRKESVKVGGELKDVFVKKANLANLQLVRYSSSQSEYRQTNPTRNRQKIGREN